jgi:hypothetical protein
VAVGKRLRRESVFRQPRQSGERDAREMAAPFECRLVFRRTVGRIFEKIFDDLDTRWNGVPASP